MILAEVDTLANVKAGVRMVVEFVVGFNLAWARGLNQTHWPRKLFFDLMLPIVVVVDLYRDRMNGAGRQ